MATWIQIDCPDCRRRLRLPAPASEPVAARLRLRCAGCGCQFTIRRPRRGERVPEPVPPPAPPVPVSAPVSEAASPGVPAYIRRRPYRSLDPEVQARRRRLRRWYLGGAAVVGVALALASWWARPQLPPEAPVPSAKEASAVAVLGWRPADGVASSPWMGAALSQMSAAALETAGVPRVVAGAEIARLARELKQDTWSAEDPLAPVARNLGVGRLLLGTYRDAGDGSGGLVLDLRMVDAAGDTLADAREEASVASLAAAVGRLAQTVVAASGTATSARDAETRDAETSAVIFPTAPLILEPYARGRLELDRSLPASARAYLRLAVLAAPDSAEVHRALAEAWGTMGHRREAEQIGRKALELGAGLPEPWRRRAEAELERWRGDTSTAARLYRRLREDRPQSLEPVLDELRLWLEAGRPEEAAALVELLAGLPPPAGEDPRIELAAAAVAEARQQPEAQRAAAEKALEAARVRGAVTWQAAAHRATAAADLALGHLEQAEAALAQARRLYRDADDPTGVGRVDLLTAVLATARRDAAGAEEAYRSAEAAFRRAGDLGTVAAALIHRGQALTSLGQPGRGLDSLGEAVDLYAELGDVAGQIAALRARSALYRSGGDARAAEGELRQAVALLELSGRAGTGDGEQIARLQLDLGEVLAARERFRAAQAAYEQCLELAAGSGREPAAGALGPVVAAAHSGLAELALVAGDVALARRHQEDALELRRELGEPLEEARVRLSLAALDLAEDRAPVVLEQIGGLIDTFLEAGDSPGLLTARVLRARALTAVGETLEARRELSTAAAMLGPGIQTELALTVSLADARLVAAEGDPRRAVRILQQQLAESVGAERMGPSLELRLALGELELAGALEAAGRARRRARGRGSGAPARGGPGRRGQRLRLDRPAGGSGPALRRHRLRSRRRWGSRGENGMKRGRMKWGLLALWACLSACGVSVRGPALPAPSGDRTMPPGTFRDTLAAEAGGRARTFELHVPASYDPARPAPLVVVIHGAFNTGRGMAEKTRFSALAERQGFVVAYPDGIGLGGLFQHWNAGFCCGKALRIGLDDVGFLDRVLDRVQELLAIDEDRVYMIGESNGAMLTYLYAAERSERLAAVGVSAGAHGGRRSTDGQVWHVPTPSRPVPLVVFHGLADERVPFGGGAAAGTLPVAEALAFWAAANGCAGEPHEERLRQGALLHRRWSGEGCAPVELWALEGWGHEWPGGKPAEKLAPEDPLFGFDATAVAWDFFRRQRRGVPAQPGP